LKLPMFPSREFVSRALVSSRKQASIANFWISLNLCVFLCMWFLFCIFSLLRVHIFLSILYSSPSEGVVWKFYSIFAPFL
jgi:hypothetical protein